MVLSVIGSEVRDPAWIRAPYLNLGLGSRDYPNRTRAKSCSPDLMHCQDMKSRDQDKLHRFIDQSQSPIRLILLFAQQGKPPSCAHVKGGT